ncbi:MAG: 3-deoxy-manno-octulosonate cytidylyltransferase [Alphaproteobacteria bacterium]|jgi:3-deoxy-manno-octulosonate cytidylyltransferase (CMP-KDO synthetase)|nr:3-deoxy-manno-octulosonate cytidylyltransferase [Alphaproteobacteria bacterium]
MTIAIIPARMASSRFPGKPLADIHGMAMIGHCYFRTAMSDSVDSVYIATCDDEIMDYARSIGAPCMMTADTHERASDRIAEAMLKIEDDTGEKHDIVVLIQGDEPMLHPDMIDAMVKAMENEPDLKVANGVAAMKTVEEFEDPNDVKVVVDPDGNAIYFSREAIPSRSKWDGDVPMLKQVCIIPFRRDYLLEYNATPQTPLEIIESVDMLRIIENGGKIRMVEMHHETLSVDTPEDLERVRKMMANDPLMARYAD